MSYARGQPALQTPVAWGAAQQLPATVSGHQGGRPVLQPAQQPQALLAAHVMVPVQPVQPMMAGPNMQPGHLMQLGHPMQPWQPTHPMQPMQPIQPIQPEPTMPAGLSMQQVLPPALALQQGQPMSPTQAAQYQQMHSVWILQRQQWLQQEQWLQQQQQQQRPAEQQGAPPQQAQQGNEKQQQKQLQQQQRRLQQQQRQQQKSIAAHSVEAVVSKKGMIAAVPSSYTMPPLPGGAWQSGVCACCDDGYVCMVGFYMYPCLHAENYRKITGDSSFLGFCGCCVLAMVCPLCAWVYGSKVRTLLRKKYGLPPGCSGCHDDCCPHFFCAICAVCQEARELRAREHWDTWHIATYSVIDGF